jgi:hypothetical protein
MTERKKKDTKMCSVCKEVKLNDLLHFDKHRAWCKICRKHINHHYYSNNKSVRWRYEPKQQNSDVNNE